MFVLRPSVGEFGSRLLEEVGERLAFRGDALELFLHARRLRDGVSVLSPLLGQLGLQFVQPFRERCGLFVGPVSEVWFVSRTVSGLQQRARLAKGGC